MMSQDHVYGEDDVDNDRWMDVSDEELSPDSAGEKVLMHDVISPNSSLALTVLSDLKYPRIKSAACSLIQARNHRPKPYRCTVLHGLG